MPRRSTQAAKARRSPRQPQITVAFCNRCGRSTKHDLIHAHQSSYFRDDTSIALSRAARSILKGLIDADDDEHLDKREAFNTFAVRFEVLTCRGCDHVIGRRREYPSYLDEFGLDNLRGIYGQKVEALIVMAQYPPAVARRAPEWVLSLSESSRYLPKEVAELMEEVYHALQNGSRRLVGMGIRSVLERIMLTKTADQALFQNRSFSENLAEFREAGHISEKQEGVLHKLIEIGNASIHRAWLPSSSELATLLDITENVIETVYLHGPVAGRLHKKVPKKPVRPRSNRDMNKTLH